jgi:hypothetical protein
MQETLSNARWRNGSRKCSPGKSPSLEVRVSFLQAAPICRAIYVNRTAIGFENSLHIHPPLPPSRFVKAFAAWIIVHELIDLQPVKTVPLKTERRSVRLRRHETGKGSHDWSRCAVIGTSEAAARIRGSDIPKSRGMALQVAGAVQGQKSLYSPPTHAFFPLVFLERQWIRMCAVQ